MKKLLLTTLCIGLSATLTFAQTIIPPVQTNPISFVIAIDSEAFAYAEREVLAYRDLLENEGRSVYIVHHNWTCPLQVRKEINKIYNCPTTVLEGVVMIGNIPMVMVQGFHHATTAFKASRYHPLSRTLYSVTVPSDRFYDDPALQFRFVEKDSNNPLLFYLELTGSSSQIMNSPFYSSRILPPSDRGQNRLEEIKKFMAKVVRERQIVNPLDCFVSFSGIAYNSDCLTAWSNEELAFRETFPKAFQRGSTAKFLNFRTDPLFKFSASLALFGGCASRPAAKMICEILNA